MPYANRALETLLWSSIVDDDDNADNFDPSQGLINHVDCLLAKFEAVIEAELPNFDPEEDFLRHGDAWEQLEHDFILTVNGHGSGFWDGGWNSGDELTAICREHFREIEVYKGDDGMIYAC